MDAPENSQLYLVWIDPTIEVPALEFEGDAKELATNLWLYRSPLSRSKAYHRIKWQLPDDTALLLAPMDDDREGWPKFKGLNEGSLGWLRR